jgi:hypothetical protein
MENRPCEAILEKKGYLKMRKHKMLQQASFSTETYLKAPTMTYGKMKRLFEEKELEKSSRKDGAVTEQKKCL